MKRIDVSGLNSLLQLSLYEKMLDCVLQSIDTTVHCNLLPWTLDLAQVVIASSTFLLGRRMRRKISGHPQVPSFPWL